MSPEAHPRQPSGSPTGGQFAGTVRAETGTELVFDLDQFDREVARLSDEAFHGDVSDNRTHLGVCANAESDLGLYIRPAAGNGFEAKVDYGASPSTDPRAAYFPCDEDRLRRKLCDLDELPGTADYGSERPTRFEEAEARAATLAPYLMESTRRMFNGR